LDDIWANLIIDLSKIKILHPPKKFDLLRLYKFFIPRQYSWDYGHEHERK